ncbi:MAG: hypothetical protein ACXQTP_06680 [Candidatus Methanofastidiosia archaeon]
MIVVFAIDALEHALVERFNCMHLKQKYYGKTDISEFSEPRTMVLWSSFMTGSNKEKEILALGDKKMWDVKQDIGNTFFKCFENPKVIDLPGFSYDKKQHDLERSLLKQFFNSADAEEKEDIKKRYNKHAFEYHRKVKSEFKDALNKDHDFVLGYFSVADVIGHLNFGNQIMMKMIYRDFDEMASQINDSMVILSDHGMKAIGAFGDHSEYGFWSTGFKDLKNPKITDFPEIVKELMEV